ncbi:MAG: sensor histidine kinase [Myxococcota bacterium]
MDRRVGSAPPKAEPDRQAQIEDLSRRLEQALAEVRRLDARCEELENEMVQRGVKLSCARMALARAKLAFDETTRHREQMVQDVAHDLRTPLTSIKGAAQNLLDGLAGPLPSDAQEYVDIVREHSDRLIGAVDWLLEAMRTTAEPIDMELDEVELGALCSAVVHGLLPIALERGIELALEPAQVTVVADADKIRQVLENLVSNALKFTERDGSVKVTLEADAEDAYIRVRDTGIGMDAEEVARIFQRYYRRYKHANHSGLGLDIAREVVRLHGGDICVESEPHRGSEFTVRLPREGPAAGPWVPGCE